MRVIPVIDLLQGLAVHAVKGERGNYKPVRSVLCDAPEPIMVARAFRDRLGLNDVYIADLDAIQDSGKTDQSRLIAALALNENMNIMLDAGISKVEEAQTWLRLGVRKAVAGSETLCSWAALREFPARIDSNRLVFSLDMKDGKILSRCPEVAALFPLEAIKHLRNNGWKEIIILDLSRVGSGAGIDRELVTQARTLFPDVDLLVGGGIAASEQLIELKQLGVAGALIATAFHRGTITAQHIKRLKDSKTQGSQEY